MGLVMLAIHMLARGALFIGWNLQQVFDYIISDTAYVFYIVERRVRSSITLNNIVEYLDIHLTSRRQRNATKFRRNKCQRRYCYRYLSRGRRTFRIIGRLTRSRHHHHHLLALHADIMNALQPPDNDHSFDTDSFLIGLDNCASYCMTNNESDFVGKTESVKVKIKGLSGAALCTVRGTVCWKILDDDGRIHEFTIPNTYLVKQLPMRLLSPQHLAQIFLSKEKTTDGTYCLTLHNRSELVWHDRAFHKTIQLNASNIGVIRSAPQFERFNNFESNFKSQSKEPSVFQSHLIPPDEDDVVLNGPVHSVDSPTGESTQPPQTLPDHTFNIPSQPSRDELERSSLEPTVMEFDHEDTAPSSHANGVPVFDDIEDENLIKDPSSQMLVKHYRLGHLPFSRMLQMAKEGDLPKSFLTCRLPECAACRFGRATKVPWRVKGKQNSKIRTANSPGACVSVDQLESRSPGLIAQLKGRATRHRYHYATIFVDHFSSLSYIYLHKSITGEETVAAKRAFEAYSMSLGVKILHYHADNGRFADNLFLSAVKEMGQTISFCGVNAHFQNGIAEKRIRDLQESARTQIIFAKHRWPAAIEVALWPYALRYANSVHNNTTLRSKPTSPIELFANVAVKPKIKHFHTFGCPVYVLDNKLQSSQSLPKWESRSRVGINLGPSPRHSRSVALVLNLDTGMASPQYHVRYDDLFETVAQISIKSSWQRICHFSSQPNRKWNVLEDNDPTQVVEEIPNIPLDATIPLDPDPIPTAMIREPAVVANQPDDIQPAIITGSTRPPGKVQPPNATPPAITTRSGRATKPTQRFAESQAQRQQGIVSYNVEFEAIDEEMYIEEDKLRDLEDPIAYALKASNDPDTMYMHEAMRQPDAKQFKEAMVKEIKDHDTRKHWKVVEKKNIPQGTIILPAVWSMKRKRRITTREIYKWKARLNLGGHKMVPGVHYDPGERYAPALSWQTIRLFLTLSIIFKWKTRQIDFVLAYPQAKIQRPTYMELPRGVNFPELDRNKHCLEIVQNIYGGKTSSRTWYLHLKEGLSEKLGFEVSKIDECVFYRGTTVILVYSDDCIILDKTDEGIQKCIDDLQKIFEVEDEGTIEDYLGVKVEELMDGSIKLSQPHLIDSILEDLGLVNNKEVTNESKGRPTPALSTQLIGPDREGEAFDYKWSMRSVIGKLNFLEKSSRLDISYATHMCARFVSEPKRSHGEAVKRIGRYLLGTRDQGIIIRPQKEKSFECYVDADYLGNWDKRIASKDPDTAKSRTGFVVKYAGVPIYWASRLQTQFALSSAESEFIALSTAMRHVKDLMFLMDEINERLVAVETVPTIYCVAYEDNSAALEIAKYPKMRPRTRTLNVIYHHFRNEVANGRVIIQAISTKLQQADILTKQTTELLQNQHRFQLMGW
jgi:hypothetical protein